MTFIKHQPTLTAHPSYLRTPWRHQHCAHSSRACTARQLTAGTAVTIATKTLAMILSMMVGFAPTKRTKTATGLLWLIFSINTADQVMCGHKDSNSLKQQQPRMTNCPVLNLLADQVHKVCWALVWCWPECSPHYRVCCCVVNPRHSNLKVLAA